MEANLSFHPGIMTKYSRAELRARRAQKEKEKRRKERKTIPSVPIKKEVWRILPCEMKYSFAIDSLKGTTFIEKMAALKDYGSFLKAKSDLFPNFEPNKELQKTIFEMRDKCIELCKRNQTLRWIFKRFVTKWRIMHFKQINDTDFITLGPITKKVSLPIFSQRAIYVFEANSILQDIHRKLLQSTAQIPTPVFPRNPYTNERFSMHQILGIHSQCKAHGVSVWTLEAFFKANLRVDLFLQLQRKPLRIHAIKTILYNYSDWDGIDLLLNFIESHHEEHQAIFNKHIYIWCLQKIPEEPKIQAWRGLCRDYYMEDILADDEEERDKCFYKYSQKTEPLCAPPHDLLAKKSLYIRAKNLLHN